MEVVWVVLGLLGCLALRLVAQALLEPLFEAAWKGIFREHADLATIVGGWLVVAAMAVGSVVAGILVDAELGLAIAAFAAVFGFFVALNTRAYRREHARPRAHDPRRTAPD